jgi:hypothetical protein
VTLAQLVYQISTDPEFATKFRAQPRTALAAAGSTLTQDELSALLHVLEAKGDQMGSLIPSPSNPWWFADPFKT